jgi:hypothetical protein
MCSGAGARLPGVEAFVADLDIERAGGHTRNVEVPAAIGSRFRHRVGGPALPHSDVGIGNSGAGGVAHEAGNRIADCWLLGIKLRCQNGTEKKGTAGRAHFQGYAFNDRPEF